MEIRQIVWEGVGGLKTYDDKTFSQVKLDGSQYHLHIARKKAYGLTSRRVSVKTNKLSEKIDHFLTLAVEEQPFNKETIFVCEASADHLKKDFDAGKLLNRQGEPFNWNKRSNYVASVMNSDVKNMSSHNIVLVVFDILYYEGEHVEHLPYLTKLNIIRSCGFGKWAMNKKMDSSKIYYMPSKKTTTTEEVQSFFQETVDRKLEGTVVKDGRGSASEKIKKELDADCIITGYVKGNNKYEEKGWIGSIIVSVFSVVPNGVHGEKLTKKLIDHYADERGYLIEVGKISGFNEEFRAKVSANKNKYLGSVLHCEYMNWTGKKMRHPRVGEKLIRKDKPLKRCTLNQFEG